MSLSTPAPPTTAHLTSQLDRMEAEGVIDLATVDFDVRRPDLVRQRLAPTLDYFARVEREVERNLLEIAAFLPGAGEETQRFVRIWAEQELPHGEIFETLKAHLGLPPSQPDLTTVSLPLRVTGRLSAIPGVSNVLLMLYHSMGAMHERLTAVGYDKLRDRLLEIGEHGFAHTAVTPIRKQESGHYAFYRNSALALRGRMAAWQLALARIIRIRTYEPIGVRTSLTAGADRATFGRTAVALLGGSRDMSDISVPVQRVAQDLLVGEKQGLRLPPFVAKALRRTVDAAYA
jgi:hypothetical protein